jgi:lysine 2,3-aminomutase
LKDLKDKFREQLSYRRSLFPSVEDRDWDDWKWQFRNRITTLGGLKRFISIELNEFSRLDNYEDNLHIGVTPYYLSLVNPDDENDPVRKQVVPSSFEFHDDRCSADPLKEKATMPVPGVVHRYPDRALFLTTNICPVYCRHCMRKREWAKDETPKTPSQLSAMVDYVRGNSSIREVMISGGDPLSLPLELLEHLLKELRQIPHLEIIRLASRYPVVLPQRITKEVAELLKRYFPVWFVTHFNHANEITEESAKACRTLLDEGIPVLNQSVLLKGVNDEPLIIEALMRGLLKIGVKPYYLFQCDPVKGVSHFRTSVFRGIEIMEHLRGRVSGLAQPTFALDTEGGGKIPLLPNYVMSYTENSLIVRNYEGKMFEYENPVSKEQPDREAPILPFEVISNS